MGESLIIFLGSETFFLEFTSSVTSEDVDRGPDYTTYPGIRKSFGSVWKHGGLDCEAALLTV
ncbi:hypothetical protein EYF80_049009 [Liparis tanakae]|uniref:Uncharacterized protein n=1 Tax=Liparis tanakae TaxID=230148 RepID=A0A4Z2FHW6_9TELE|nr:hypothetical protein EYF80_049009 [Liparis tanakae]